MLEYLSNKVESLKAYFSKEQLFYRTPPMADSEVLAKYEY